MAKFHSRPRMNLDDLGLPAEGDPHAFALAFAAVTHQCDLRVAISGDQSPGAYVDDLGLPVEGDPADYACAFAAMRREAQPCQKA
jgi:hypothetical protein